ncbi:DUF4238 domain-containing protein [Bradyrhizobium sp. SZCCHNS3053]|uniref:DUF4238 domain-containing protein n=1 Tax=Bradyrhizobium sp. SZCCHNS3053 TaxID=3057322 RepID=UPI002916DEC3|nr:DUF4238 domain-containing protein [Bradyrhizobium sp. SZCCHNS3053]
MSKTRNNHYVPQWYQEGFFEPGRNTLAYLDLTPPQKTLDDGRVIRERDLFHAPTSRAFRQIDLYSTFFGTSVNDEIERHLFGDIDAKGSLAIRAFAGNDVGEWHLHFQKLFEYIDIQKIRTPKGLDWLRTQYPTMTQNELMVEMQGIRMMHCTIWTQGVREIVSAEDADVKFIISDHPVTIYNYAAPPAASMCTYPNDPTIALKASQTIFPLSRDYCLVFTNLEYANDPATGPLDKRTFARNYRNSMARTDAFIRTRKLSVREIAQINYVLKARAHRYVAAGRKEWLFPEKTITETWAELRETLLPPKEQLWHFGGEIFARFESGDAYYQDQFGRTEKERDFLKKQPANNPRPGDWCGCGSGRRFNGCCELKPTSLRPTWTEASIRERNMMLYNGLVNVLGLEPDKDWVTVRRELTDEKISLIYQLYEGLWPLETDLLHLLPKPDGFTRGVFTGSLHPDTIADFALGASLYLGEMIVEHPFLHAGTVKKEFSPVENPRSYRQETIKTLVFFLTVMPLIERGLINLVPDPCIFDSHLRDQMFRMAQLRSAGTTVNDLREDKQFKELARQEFQRSLLMLSQEDLRSQLLRFSPKLEKADIERALQAAELLKEQDPLAVLQPGSLGGGKTGGQFNLMKLAPNFEMTLYLAQATGSFIVTDNIFRWNEIRRAVRRRGVPLNGNLSGLANSIESSTFAFPQNVPDIGTLASDKAFTSYPALIRNAFKYLTRSGGEAKPNYEGHLTARFVRTHSAVQSFIRKAGVTTQSAKISCAFPLGGVQDNSVNRLLLMSSSERHLPSSPMAFLIQAAESQLQK